MICLYHSFFAIYIDYRSHAKVIGFQNDLLPFINAVMHYIGRSDIVSVTAQSTRKTDAGSVYPQSIPLQAN
jgi:hypothetical protein